MGKHSKFYSISEFCKKNNFKPLKFYEILSRHPELAKKIKINSAGERVLDEEAMRAAGAILRKRSIEECPDVRLGKSPVSTAADEINTLAAKNEELREEVRRLKCENEKLKNIVKGKKNVEI